MRRESEREYAVILADKVLDRPFIDPDGDLCVLARQFLRAEERIKALEAGSGPMSPSPRREGRDANVFLGAKEPADAR